MSTRATINYGPTFHLYLDTLDQVFVEEPERRDRLWLELEDVECTVATRQGGKGVSVKVELTPAVLKALRDHLCDGWER